MRPVVIDELALGDSDDGCCNTPMPCLAPMFVVTTDVELVPGSKSGRIEVQLGT